VNIWERGAHSPTHVHFGRAVRHMRARQGVSRRRLARACAIKRRDFARLEHGHYDPDLRLLEQLGTTLNGTLMTLMLQLANQEYLTEIGGPRNLIGPAAPPRRCRWRRRRRVLDGGLRPLR
jgi:transcriptional regulator with XRE-family HTH domain